MSNKYELVKRYFELGMWSEERVRNAVIKGWITENEFETIVRKEC